ncbi:unnamed protein product [Ilex paraguariensis]|uniref:Uncharacterized protein n=1 Tax=Ilex paraguariensis TaxID=185542 RepID=A0ABC8URJ1_9AQUA
MQMSQGILSKQLEKIFQFHVENALNKDTTSVHTRMHLTQNQRGLRSICNYCGRIWERYNSKRKRKRCNWWGKAGVGAGRGTIVGNRAGARRGATIGAGAGRSTITGNRAGVGGGATARNGVGRAVTPRNIARRNVAPTISSLLEKIR